jgi:hypothetical protein
LLDVTDKERKGRKSVFIKNIAVITLCMAPFAAQAAVTVYDEEKGRDVEAELQGGELERLPELKIQQAPRRAEQTPLVEPEPEQAPKEKAYIQPTDSPSDIVLLPWDIESYDLGHAQIFLDSKEMDENLAKNLMQIKNIDGLRVSVYMKPPENIGDIILLAVRGVLKTPGIEYKTDAKNKRFKALGLKESMTVYYTSPFGDSRAFPLAEPQYVLNKVDYVRRQVRGE